MNEHNLNPVRTESEARERGRKGGIASGKARLRKKQGRELLRLLLSMSETDPIILAEMERLGISAKDASNEVVVHARQIEKAKRKADTFAYNALMKAAGYMEEREGSETVVNVNVTNLAIEASKKWGNK